MVLKIKHFVVFITIMGINSCNQEKSSLQTMRADNIAIDSSIVAIDSILEFTEPYRERINTVLDSALAYSPIKISKTDGKYNTTAGNLMADIIREQAQPIFKARTGKNIDFVLVNQGGIRSIISKGKVSARTAYEVMPFENNIVVVELSGKSVLAMVDYLISSKRAHPISGIQIILNKDESVKEININGNPLEENKNYFVATSNYLVSGGDNMVFFKGGLGITDTDYLIRNAMIDYFKKIDTLRVQVDDRYYMLE